MFLELGDYVNFVPGTVMIIFSASAIALTAWVWLSNRNIGASSPQPTGPGQFTPASEHPMQRSSTNGALVKQSRHSALL